MSPILSSPLACRTPSVGEPIMLVGNPFIFEFTRVRGEIISREVGKIDDYGWKSSILASVTIGFGNSGGPVFDMDGNVVGIAVGLVAQAPTFAILVPGATVCKLLGRAA
jgi:S1-C subfamily serine protease